MNSVTNFINYIEYQKRYSEHTIKSYRKDLHQFRTYLRNTFKIEEPHEALQDQIRSWIVSLVSAHISPSTINRKISSLKSYYKYQQKIQAINQSPMIGIKALKLPKRLPTFLQESQINEVLDIQPQTYSETRDLLIIELLYRTGMRRSELINLKDSDLDFSNQVLKVLGKGKKQRLCPIQPDLISLIKNYQTIRDKRFNPSATATGSSLVENTRDSSSVFLTDKGKKMYPKLVYNRVKHYLKKVTTLEKKSPHILRHSFATHLANRGAELSAIRSLLGHSSLASTQIYTHTTIEQLKNIHESSHPKA